MERPGKHLIKRIYFVGAFGTIGFTGVILYLYLVSKLIRFIRAQISNGETKSSEVRHLKRFENGKIAEIWEYFGCK